MATPEGKVKEAVKRELKKRGIWFYMPVQNGMGVVGIPDLICCWEGKFLAIETKAPGKRTNTTPNQERVLNEIRTHGGHSIVVDDVSQLIEYLEHHYE
jgi:VRR-NUC domain